MTRFIHLSASLAKAACLISIFSSAAFAGTAAYRGVILSDNPVVYYELDEISGTSAANSATTGATYNGTISGTVTVGQTSFAQGGAAYDFGGGEMNAVQRPEDGLAATGPIVPPSTKRAMVKV